MRFVKAIMGSLALAACSALVPSSSAQTLQVLTAGSSAQFGPFAVAAYALAKNGGQTAYHYTVKTGSCANGSTTCYASLSDTRTVSGSTIVNEPGNLWVVWSANGVWAYLSVDSTVGVRAFSAVPRATLALAAQSSLPLITTAPYTAYTFWGDGTHDTALTTTVYNALNSTALTAANTDIRPEDALFATNRALNTLGYGSVADPRSGHSGQFLIGKAIQSFFTPTAVANPVSFAIAGGADPFTGQTGPTQITLPVGAAPVVFLASTATGSTVASATNITGSNAASLFSGVGGCASSLVVGATGAISPILREPLSGTMNTAEYSVFVPGHSQETGVSATADNPLDQTCGSGVRYRAVGTGDEVNGVVGHANTVGYAFFSYESVGGGKTDRYITLNGVDPINSSYSASNGALPTCPVVNGSYSCPVAGGASFPNLRKGTYKAWSIYRVVTDSSGQTNAKKLVAKAQALVDSNIPDFVPFTPVCAVTSKLPNGTANANDPGLAIYREHFVPSTITTIPDTITINPNDGSLGSTKSCTVIRGSLPALTLGGGTEQGGDVGGTVQGPFTTSPTYPGPTESQPH